MDKAQDSQPSDTEPLTRDIAVFDLDGTLADCEHRRVRFLLPSKKDYTGFYRACPDDTPIWPICEILNSLKETCEIWIVSGRSDEVANETYLWLHKHGIHYDRIIMRPAGCYIEDDLLKESWLVEGRIPKERILAVFDDRDRVVAMWRKHGLTCCQVAPGNF